MKAAAERQLAVVVLQQKYAGSESIPTEQLVRDMRELLSTERVVLDAIITLFVRLGHTTVREVLEELAIRNQIPELTRVVEGLVSVYAANLPAAKSLEQMADTTPGYTANRAVNAIPVVCAAAPGIRTTVELPHVIARLQDR